jgi:hypothetical protein
MFIRKVLMIVPKMGTALPAAKAARLSLTVAGARATCATPFAAFPDKGAKRTQIRDPAMCKAAAQRHRCF